MRLKQAQAWSTAAEADGWAFSPTYKSESPQRHVTGKHLGFTVMVNTRDDRQADVTVWGPDGLQIEAPLLYSMRAVRLATRVCLYCHASDVPTMRVGFAGRACASCAPSQRRKQEFPGWTN